MIDYQALTNSTDAPRSYLSAADSSDTEQPRQRDGSRAAVEVRQLEEEFCLSVASLNECFLFTSGSPSLAPGGAGLSGETCACVCVCVCWAVTRRFNRYLNETLSQMMHTDEHHEQTENNKNESVWLDSRSSSIFCATLKYVLLIWSHRNRQSASFRCDSESVKLTFWRHFETDGFKMSSFGRYHSNVKLTFVSKSEEFLSLRKVSLTLNISDC